MTQGLLSKLIWVGLIVFIFIGVIYAAEKTKEDFLEPWIYQTLENLHLSGFLPDYPADWVGSGNQLSRFEVAYYIKGLITKDLASKDLSKQVIEQIQKLLTEFKSELTDLGIQVTNISQISPKLDSVNQTSEYQDLDLIISSKKEEKTSPYYYYGQYFSDFQRKSFIFIPSEYVGSGYIDLLEGAKTNINIVYQPSLEDNHSFLVVKGSLPSSEGKQPLAGYYLFPLENTNAVLLNNGKFTDNKINESVLNLLDEVNGINQVDSLWKYNGVLPLDGYLQLDTGFQSQPLAGTLNQGLRIGSYLINTENPTISNQFEVNKFGLPTYNSRQVAPSSVMDLDAINGKNLQSLQINISGTVSLGSQTSVYGGLDFLYRGTNTGLETPWPSDTKASAGVNYRVDNYWSVLTYQSLVNSQLKTGLLSTTSIGVDYNDWVTLWLAYQLLNFDDPVVSGTLSVRF